MWQKKSSFMLSGTLAVLAAALMVPTWAGGASKYKALYKFTGGSDGAGPHASLIFDPAGNLYGTTFDGGSTSCSGGGCGTVFKLSPNSDGSWTESVLYSFTGGGDGSQPLAGLIFDAAGNLYGTTYTGGYLTCGAPEGCGVVFKLKANSNGSWTESVLHRFTGADGQWPEAGVIFDSAGNLYGMTTYGGSGCASYGCGVVFKLTPKSDGSWTERVLHRFAGGADGQVPYAGLIFDAARNNLYGTTSGGGHWLPSPLRLRNRLQA